MSGTSDAEPADLLADDSRQLDWAGVRGGSPEDLVAASSLWSVVAR